MTLSRWFRDYVYIPLGGNRVRRGRFALNLLIVWALTGLWHGASWNYVLWGLYYGVLLVIERLVIGKRLERLPVLLRWLVTFALVNIGWVFFCISDPPLILEKLRRMFVYMPTDWRALLSLDASVCSKALSLPFALLFSFPILKKAAAPEKGMRLIVLNGMHLVLLIVCIMFIISSSFTPFVYFNF